MALKDDEGVWAVKALRREDASKKTISFNLTWAGGRIEQAAVDTATGLTVSIGAEVEPEDGRKAYWLTLIDYDAQGVEKGRGTYVDANRNKEIDASEKELWVMIAQRQSLDKANQRLINRFRKADNSSGEMAVNVQVGKEVGGTAENIDMGDGLFEKFSYEIFLGDNLREIGRTTTTRGEL